MATLTQDRLNELLTTIHPVNVERVYVGKTGCACGCKGTYTESISAAKRTLNRLQKAAQSFGPENWDIIEERAFGKGGFILSFEPVHSNRATRLYVRPYFNA